MDKYFCKDCLHLWENGKYMLCCKGCVAHRDAGWTPKLLLDIYGPILKISNRAYFPFLDRRVCQKRQYTSDSTPVMIKTSVSNWLTQQGFLLGFVEQQTKILNLYNISQDVKYWNAIDPLIQDFILRPSLIFK